METIMPGGQKPPAPRALPNHGRYRFGRYAAFYALSAPALVSLFIWLYLPILNSIRMAFFRWDGYITATFVGLDNFIALFGDKFFWISLRNMFLILLFQFGLPLIMPFLTSELIHAVRGRRMRRLYQTLFLVPSVVPVVVGLIIWRHIYAFDGGLNELLRVLGLRYLIHDWLQEPNLALPAIMMINFPFSGGGALLVFQACLESIPGEVSDMATIDGAGWWNKLRRVDIPFCLTGFRLVIITALSSILANYVVVMLLTQGGPLFRTLVPGYYLYDEAFNGQRYGFACAMGLVLMVFVVTLTVCMRRYLKSSYEFDSGGNEEDA